jgi:predicted TIM-barrel fold metal-dependent hydrolase
MAAGLAIIDFHTHPVLIQELVERDPEYKRMAREVFNIGNNFQPLETFLLQMDVAGVDRAVLLPADCRRARGCAAASNDQVRELCDLSDRFIGFASVDPLRPGAARELETAIGELRLRGVALDPALQDFSPEDERMFEVLEAAAAARVPVCVNTGMSWAPETPLQRAHPLLWEKSIRRFPSLPFVLAHWAWPWVWEATALALKYPNVYLDTGCLYFDSPKECLRFVLGEHIPISIVERSLRTKVVFGSNYPRVEIKNMTHAVRSLGLTERCQELVFRDNAAKLLESRRDVGVSAGD